MARRNRKPPIKDFIVAAIRKLRPHPHNLKPNTASGIRLSRVYKVALAVYTDREFREGLVTAMNEEEVIIHGVLHTVKKREGRRWGASRHEIISSIAEDVPLQLDTWHLDKGGHPVNPEEVEEHEKIHSIRMCVIADGLPKKVRNILAPQSNEPNKSLADEIIDSM